MRKFLLFFAAFVFALVTMPIVFGLLTEYRLKSLIAESDLPEGTIVEIKSYDRGYLKAHTVVNLTLLEPQAPQENTSPSHKVSFNIEADIQNGPLFHIADKGLRSGMAQIHIYIKPEDLAIANEELAKTISNIFADKEVFSVNATLSLLGTLNAHIHSSAANYQSEKSSITWGGIDGDIKMTGDNNAVHVMIDISPMLIQGENHASLDFSRISILSDAKRKTGMPWVGEQALNVPSFFMRDDKGKEVRFSNLLVTAKTNIDGALTKMDFNAKADNLEMFSQAITDTQLSMTISKLDAKSFVKFGDMSQTNMEFMTDEQKKDFTRTVISMLSPGTEFEFQHDMNLKEGPVNTKISLQFPDIRDALSKEPNEVLSQRLLKEINATLAMQSPKDWLESTLYSIAVSQLPPDAPAQHDPVTNAKVTPQELIHKHVMENLKTFTQAGILINDGTHYAVHVNYANGVIELNGNKLTQEDLTRIMGVISHK